MNRNTLNIVKLLLLLVLLVICISILVLGLQKKEFLFNSKTEQIYNKSYDIKEKIQIKTVSADIRIKENTSDTIQVVAYGAKNDRINESLTEEDLELEYVGKHFCIGFCFYENYIEISIPSSYQGTVILESTSGDIEMGRLENGMLEIKTVSGDIEIETIKSCDIKTTSGDINVKQVESATLTTISGDIEMESLTYQIKAISTSGDIQIHKIALQKNSDIKTVSGDVTINNQENIYFQTDTKSGDIRIKGNNRYAENELKVITTSGDITID